MSVLRRVFESVSSYLPSKTVVEEGTDRVLLTRYKVWDTGDGGSRCYIHNIVDRDEPGELHNHPWGYAWVWVAVGGYIEERATTKKVIVDTGSLFGRYVTFDAEPRAYTWTIRSIKPGTIYRLTQDFFHRVHAVGAESSWSIMLGGKVTSAWGFLSNNKYIPWKEYRRLDWKPTTTGDEWEMPRNSLRDLFSGEQMA